MHIRLLKNTRYYFIELSKNLFDEFELRRIYGNVNYKSHTGEKVAYYNDKEVAIKAYNLICKQKMKRGYA